MKDVILFEPIAPNTYFHYIEVGTKAYNQHYRHLWPNGNSAPYIEHSFTRAILEKEAKDRNTILYLIYQNQKAVGIFKIVLDAVTKDFTKEEALCIEKIYILKEYSGKGIGKKVLQFVLLRARELSKKIVWLDTMQQGPALQFYLKNGFEIHSESKVSLPNIIEDKSAMWVMIKECEKN